MTLLARKSQTHQNGRTKRPNLERQAIFFTVSLYLFIAVSLLVVHYVVPEPPAGTDGTSSNSPFNP
ncbi:hypothetical protein EV141_0153 [Microcella putealis]|uniref:Uncharacterized protein n=1 Tax=Microcella putealis TaxID=337005 RepID=A0A4V2EXB8_9MICO|nr:hypothetical protein [Microcella putealis]RZS58940.1 hypothetical protein EV141_0153 [Microcella putealis]TQM23966.1 hypothetical protein BJ957_1432 [Microcella putealis]